MSKRLLATKSLLDVDAHELADELLGLITDVIPVWRVELEFTYTWVRGSEYHLRTSTLTVLVCVFCIGVSVCLCTFVCNHVHAHEHDVDTTGRTALYRMANTLFSRAMYVGMHMQGLVRTSHTSINASPVSTEKSFPRLPYIVQKLHIHVYQKINLCSQLSCDLPGNPDYLLNPHHPGNWKSSQANDFWPNLVINTRIQCVTTVYV